MTTRIKDEWKCTKCGGMFGRHDMWFEGDVCGDCNIRKFTLVYVEKTLDSREDTETVEMTIEEILEMVNDESCHSDEWTDYDETDWLEGLLEFSDYDILLEKGDKMHWTDPDDGLCSCEVTVTESIRLTGGFGEETQYVSCNNGEHIANELS